MIEIIPGNLLEAKETVIAQQVNCKGIMGSKKDTNKTTNVASQLRQKYGDLIYNPYKEYLKQIRNPLGTIQTLPMPDFKIICNMFAQDDYGYDGKQHTSLEAFKNCVARLKEYLNTYEFTRVAMPYKIGSNRGGASWEDVYSILKETFKDSDITLVLYMKE